MSVSGGGSRGTTESKPITPEEMQAYFDVAKRNLDPLVPTGPGTVQQQTLTGGDYKALEDSYTAPLMRDRALALREADQNASDRGIYTSLNALRLRDDVNAGYAPQITAARGKALEMKANELAQGNQLAVTNEANKWRLPEYYASLWTGGKGQTSSGSNAAVQGGFNI